MPDLPQPFTVRLLPREVGFDATVLDAHGFLVAGGGGYWCSSREDAEKRLPEFVQALERKQSFIARVAAAPTDEPSEPTTKPPKRKPSTRQVWQAGFAAKQLDAETTAALSCPQCGKPCKNARGLAIHAGKEHRKEGPA